MTIEELAYQLAYREARTILQSQGVWPSANHGIFFSNGRHTREELVSLFYEHNKDRLLAKATKKAEKAEKAEKVPQ